ncbi:MAG: tetratricopeptide repeat protein, partial [Phycisphaerae bacterium]
MATLAVLGIFSFAASGISAQDAQNDGPDPALRDYLSANGLLNRGLYELATAEYRKFLSEHEDHEKAPVARYGLGVSLFRMGKFEAAVTELTPLQESSHFEFAAETGTILGQCHLARQQYPEAAEAFQWVVRKHGGHDLADEAAAGQVEALYFDGRYDDAIDECQKFVTRWSDNPLRERIEFFGAFAAMARHDDAKAADRFAALLERYPNGPFAEQASLLLAQCY